MVVVVSPGLKWLVFRIITAWATGLDDKISMATRRHKQRDQFAAVVDLYPMSSYVAVYVM
jgi:hypothetical protein